jgi:hypothetical protein
VRAARRIRVGGSSGPRCGRRRERRAHLDPAAAAVHRANLFVPHAARRAAEFFARAERHRKKPWRMIAALGPALALEYLAGTLDLDTACRQISRSAGAKIRPVLLDDAAAAIDVDKASDLDLAEKILAGDGGV